MYSRLLSLLLFVPEVAASAAMVVASFSVLMLPQSRIGLFPVKNPGHLRGKAPTRQEI